jgi:hypothetical protein
LIAVPSHEEVDAEFRRLVAFLEADHQKTRRIAVRRRRIRATFEVTGILLALAVVAGLAIRYVPGLIQRGEQLQQARRTAHATSAPGATAPVMTAVSPGALPATLLDPFAGTPAEKYATGAAGITLPKARALGGLSKKEVRAALTRTRDLLIASRLDRKTILGGRPAKFFALLDAEQRPGVVKSLDKKKGFNARAWVFSLAKGTSELATRDIKVNGTLKLSKWHDKYFSGIKIKVHYLIVYAVQRPGRPDSMMRIVSEVEGEVHAYHTAGRLQIWVYDLGAGQSGGSCDYDDEFVHPAYDDEPQRVKPSGKAVNPYDRDRDKSKDVPGCGLTTGT